MTCQAWPDLLCLAETHWDKPSSIHISKYISIYSYIYILTCNIMYVYTCIYIYTLYYICKLYALWQTNTDVKKQQGVLFGTWSTKSVDAIPHSSPRVKIDAEAPRPCQHRSKWGHLPGIPRVMDEMLGHQSTAPPVMVECERCFKITIGNIYIEIYRLYELYRLYSEIGVMFTKTELSMGHLV